MRQILFGGTELFSSGNPGVAFPTLGTAQNASGVSSNPVCDTPISIACQFNKFRLKMDAVSAVNRQFTFRNVTTGNTVVLTVLAGQTDVTDNVSTLAFSPGDLLRLSVPAHETANAPISWAVEVIGNNANEAFGAGGSDLGLNLRSTVGFQYLHPFALTRINTVILNEAIFYCPANLTIKSFYVRLTGASGGTGTRTFSIFVNGVEVAASALAFAPGDTVKNLTGLTIPIAAGDSIVIKHNITGSSVAAGLGALWGFMYNPATDGETVVAGFQEDPLSNIEDQVQYGYLSGADESNGTFKDTEARRRMIMNRTVFLRNFRVDLETSPGSGQVREFRIRKNGANGNKVVQITGAAITGSDNANSEFFVADDLVNITHVATTSGVSNTPMSRWTCILFIDPVGSGEGGGGPVPGIGGISGHGLPDNNPAVVTALKNVRQGANFPEFIFGARGGAGANTYGLYKKSTIYGQHIQVLGPFSIGRRGKVTRIKLRLGAPISDGVAITPMIFFDNESSSQNGMEITNVNYPKSGIRFITLTEDSFAKNTEFKNNFFVLLLNTGTTLCPIIMPAEVSVEIYDNTLD